MTREIKFRVFDKSNNKMSPVNSIWGFPAAGHVTIRVDDTVVTLFENFELMQFTGLKDKNGVDIYDGDITNYGKVVFENGSFGVLEESNIFISFNDINLCFYKIIGNIHQNPEML